MPAGSPTVEEQTSATARVDDMRGGRLDRVLRPARFVFGAVLFALVILATIRSWDDVGPALGRLSPVSLGLAEVLVLLGLFASAMTWRVALAEFGSLVRVIVAARIYLIGQLGKYAPGSIWALAAQMDLAARAGLPAVAALAASVVAIGANLATGLALGAFLVPTTIGGGIWRAVAIIALLVALAVALSPPVLARALAILKRHLRGGGLPGGMTWPGALRVVGWSVASWACYGLCLWVLVIGVGGPALTSLFVCVAGVALAMTLGFLVVIAPSGIGVREVVIVAALGSVLERSEALAVALAARLVFTAGDLLAALVVLGVRTTTSARVEVPSPSPIGARIEDVEAFNDALARMYPIDDYYTHASPPIRWVEQRRLACVRELVGDASGLDVAEIGSGGGHVLRMFPEARLSAIDVSSVYLDVARRNLAGYDVRFLKGEVDRLGLPSGSFDRIVCTEVLEHVVNPTAVLDEISRLLRPTGVAVITVPNDALIHRVKKLLRWVPVGWFAPERLDWGGDAYHLHRWTPREFEELLGRHLTVHERRSIPFRLLPLRVGFKCTPSRVGEAALMAGSGNASVSSA